MKNKYKHQLTLKLDTCGWDVLNYATAILFKQMQAKLAIEESTDFTLSSKNQILTLRFGKDSVK